MRPGERSTPLATSTPHGWTSVTAYPTGAGWYLMFHKRDTGDVFTTSTNWSDGRFAMVGKSVRKLMPEPQRA